MGEFWRLVEGTGKFNGVNEKYMESIFPIVEQLGEFISQGNFGQFKNFSFDLPRESDTIEYF